MKVFLSQTGMILIISTQETKFRINRKNSIRLAINAGIDVAMVPYDWDFCDLLIELVNEGSVSLERINSAVRRVLKMKAKLNLFDVPYTDPTDYPFFGSEQMKIYLILLQLIQ